MIFLVVGRLRAVVYGIVSSFSMREITVYLDKTTV